MVGWQRSVRPLSAHVIAYTVIILLRTWEAIVRGMRRSMVRYWLLRRHAIITWHKRLRLWVEGMSVEAARYWMLTLWVGRVGSAWKLSIRIWNRRCWMHGTTGLVGIVIVVLPRL